MSETITADDGESTIDIDVPDWQNTHDAVRDWINSEVTRIHVLTQTDDTLILVQRDSSPSTEQSVEGEKVVGISIHDDDDIVIQSGRGHEQGFDATGNYLDDFASINEAVDVAISQFA